MRHVECPRAEIEAGFADVHHRQPGATHLHELHDAQPDRSGTDDENEVILRDLGAFDGVRADRERLDQRELIVGKRTRAVELRAGTTISGRMPPSTCTPSTSARRNNWIGRRDRRCSVRS